MRQGCWKVDENDEGTEELVFAFCDVDITKYKVF